MTKTRRAMFGAAAIAAVVTLAGATASLAQPPAGPEGRRGPPPAEGRRGPPDGSQRDGAQREERLRERLKITPQQDTAFKAYIAATARSQRGNRPDREAMRNLTTPQRLDAQLAEASKRQAEMKTRADAAKRFYAGLTAQQRATFDQMPPGAVLGMGGPGGGQRMAMRDGRRGGRDFGGREFRGPGRPDQREGQRP